MAVIRWRESFATGVEQFDQEHKRLVALVNLMFEAIRDKRTEEVVAQASTELVAHAVEHFAHEEQAMEALAYSDIEAHKEEHAQLRAKAEQFHTRIAQKDPAAALEFYHFLREWLANHILESDKAYGPPLKQWRGL